MLVRNEAYQDLTPTQYATALDWLREVGLTVDSPTGPRPADVPGSEAERVLRIAIESSQPDWLLDQLNTDDSDELPLDLGDLCDDLEIPADAAWQISRAASKKVDLERRAEVGLAGEVRLVELLRHAIEGDVHHVALDSDGWGYDLSIAGPQGHRHIEVKSTTSRSRLVVYLSRHEFEVALRDAEWCLVGVVLVEDSICQLVEIRRDWILASGPSDRPPFARWESVRLEPPPSAIHAGTPTLADIPRRFTATAEELDLLQGGTSGARKRPFWLE